MSSLIPGVTEELFLEYLKSYNDESITNMFYVICNTSNIKKKGFRTCSEAYDYKNSLQDEEFNNRNKIYIYLNQSNGERWRLSDDIILSIIAFEADDQFFMAFQMYAEKMSRDGRKMSRDGRLHLEDFSDDESH